MLPKRNLKFLLFIRPALRWLMKLRSSPQAIAGGFALGTFIAFTPTVGAQIVIAIFFATLFGVNRPAAVLPVWISNPVTIAPIYTFNYYIGQVIWGGPPVSEVSELFIHLGKTMVQLEFWEWEELLDSVLGLGADLVVPLCLGSVVVGVVAAFIAYFPMLYLMHFLSRRRKQKHTLQ